MVVSVAPRLLRVCGSLGRDSQSGVIFVDRLRLSAGVSERVAEISMGIDRIWLQLNGLVQMVEGLGQLPGGGQRRAEIGVCLEVIGPDADGRSIMLDGLLLLALC